MSGWLSQGEKKKVRGVGVGVIEKNRERAYVSYIIYVYKIKLVKKLLNQTMKSERVSE